MDVILLQDVPKLGKKFEVKHVADGFARNSLLPRKLAEAATPGKLKELESTRAAQAQARAQEEQDRKAVFAALNGKTVTIKAKASETGSLFQGLRVSHVVDAINTECGSTLTAMDVVSDETIKEVGTHPIELAHNEHKASLTLVVEPEE